MAGRYPQFTLDPLATLAQDAWMPTDGPLPSVPPEPRVEGDLSCASCTYNILGQLQHGRCPECGFSIDESIRAAGLWSVARAVRLRRAALTFSVAVLCWLAFSAVLVATAFPTPPQRWLVGIGIVTHIGFLIWSAFDGLEASSWLSAPRRRVVLAVACLLLIMAIAPPVLTIARFIQPGSSALMPALVIANVLRVLLLFTAAWWILSGIKTLRPLWTGATMSAWVCLAAILAAWFAFAFFFAFNDSRAWLAQRTVESLGYLALGGESALCLVIAGIAIRLRGSLGRSPGRLGAGADE